MSTIFGLLPTGAVHGGPPAPPVTTIIAPPDDRYLPGYTIVESDGTTKTVGPRLLDLNVPFSLYGLPIPISWGVRKLRGNTIWARPLLEIKNVVKKGGKGGGPTTNTTTYSYFATLAVSFGKAGFRSSMLSRRMMRVWGDSNIIFDRRAGSQGDKSMIISFSNHEWFSETDSPSTRPASSIIASYEGIENTPAFRDLMLLVVENLAVGSWGDRIPAMSIEFGDITSLAYDFVTALATSGFDGEMPNSGMLVDWIRNVAYFPWAQAASPASIGTFDLKTGALLNIVEANPDNIYYAGFQATTESYTYIPWLNKILAVSNLLESWQGVLLIDPTTGVAVDNFGTPGVAGSLTDSTSLPQIAMMCPLKVYTLTGVHTYIVAAQFNSSFCVLGFDFNGFLEKVAGVDTTAAAIQLYPGEEGYGWSVMYMMTVTRIYRIKIYDNATIGTGTGTGYGIEVNEDFHIEGGSLTHNSMWYVVEDDSYIITYTNNDVKKFDRQTGDLIWFVDHLVDDVVAVPNIKAGIWMSNITNGFVGWAQAGNTLEMSIATGEFTIFNTSGTSLFSAGIYDSLSRSVVSTHTSNDRFTRVYYDKINATRMNLSDFIIGLAIEAGISASDIEVSADVNDVIDGAIITEITTWRTVMDSTEAIYRLDVIESDGKVKVKRKAQNFSTWEFEITENELLKDGNSDPEDPSFTLRRENDIILPQRVGVRFIDKSLDYQYSAQFATRSQEIQTNTSSQTLTIQTPIIMLAEEAKLAAQRMLWVAWASRVGYAFTLGPEYMRIEPADVGTITAAGIIYTIKAVNLSFNADKSISVQAQGFLSDSPLAVNAFAGVGYTQTIPGYSYSQIIPLDIPLLIGSDDLSYTGQGVPLYYYVAPLTLTTNWRGGYGYNSKDGVNFIQLLDNVSEGFVGAVSGALPDVDNPHTPDMVNTISLFAVAGDTSLIVSSTDAELLAGANAAALGAPGRWEIIQFRDVTAGAQAHQFVLSYLHRGRRGTDLMTSTHRRGDRFVLLSSEWLQKTSVLESDIGSFLDWKGVGYGLSLDQVPEIVRSQVNGYGGLPWPIGNLRAERETISDGAITIKWNRRSRTFGELVDGTGFVPISPYESNDYEVTIYRNAWVEDPLGIPIAHADGEDVAHVYTVTGAEELLIPETDLLTYLVNRYDDGASGYTNSYEWLEFDHLGLAYAVGLRYIYVMVKQKSNLATVAYGPGAQFRIDVRDVW